MITEIKLHKIASYEDIVEIKPKEINYFFGSNGVGKSSLGKVIANSSNYPKCNLKWKSNPIDVFIYNKQFIQDNFSQSNTIKGIFTLGKDSTDIQNFIEETNSKIKNLKNKIEGLEKSKIEQKEKLSQEREKAEDRAWVIKKRYEIYFKPAFKGFMGSKTDFFKKSLSEQNNNSDLLDEQEIIEKSKKIFSNDLKFYKPIDEFTFNHLSKYENSEILKTKIVGKGDIEIGKLIKELNNSDWVKEGVNYLQQTENICPFCQQSINKDLREKIESFFDETYKNKKQELNDFIQNYKTYIEGLLSKLYLLTDRDIPILDFKELNSKIELLKNTYKNNLNKLEQKLKTPSIPIEIESLEPLLSEISEIIRVFKREIEDNNSTFENIKTEKAKLKSEIWRFIANELDTDLKLFNKIKSDVGKAIKGIDNSLAIKENEKNRLEKEVEEKEVEVTSIKPTITNINHILKIFGFTNFMLDEADKKGFYKIIREDGSEAGETLSEGEYTFLTFLYFYHMLRGGINNKGINKDKIVVIDDPVSSLDSNVLFIVSNLIKELIKDIKDKTNGIKQIFILTHNVYFFKEVTFKGNRNEKLKEEAYWIIRKLNNKTNITEYEQNPIKTTYELLWRELDDIKKINSATIFNTLRRILEYYFNILGGLNYKKAINKFEGEEQIICKSLFSWVNDGSHFINDDLIVDAEPEKVEKYLKIFELIFDKMGHKSHYEMMMNIDKAET